MEQLVKYGNKAIVRANNCEQEISYYEAKRIIASKLEKKIRIELSQAQLDSFDQIITNYMSSIPLDSFVNKALIYRLFKLYTKNVEPKTAKSQKKYKISLNMSEAKAVYDMIDDTDYTSCGPFERGLLMKIYGEIDRQS